MYAITWVERQHHSAWITAAELARIKGITTRALAELDGDDVLDGLADDLAGLDSDTLVKNLPRAEH